MTTTWFSLRRRLLTLLLSGVAACWLATLALSYVDAHHEIDEIFDAQLAQAAQVLLSLAGHEADEGDEVDLGDLGHKYQQRLRFQIWGADGKLLMHSANAPRTSITIADGFSDVRDKDKHPDWRYYSQWNADHSVRVVVGENHRIRGELAGHIAWRLLAPALFGLPLLGAWIWLATRRGLKPLDAVAEQIAARDPDRLHALTPATAPKEVRPLIEAINNLFGRVEHTLESERRFTADAAHELRTPLAALATQAQVVMRARDDAERRHAIEQLIASSRRAARLVDQLLTLARLDPEESSPAETVALDRLAEEVCAAHGGMAVEKNVVLELDAMPVTVSGHADMLRILLRNLVDNAIRYTPPGSRVTVAVAPGSLSVTDTGPGIPVAERERVFARFHRMAGQDTEGSGLGLSISARIAERHGATISLTEGDAGHGLRVTVRFSAPPVPDAVS